MRQAGSDVHQPAPLVLSGMPGDAGRAREAMIAFLSSERFPGIGPKTAAAVVDTFGERLGHVVEHEPERLRDVVSAARAKAITAGWREAKGLGELVRALADAGVPPYVAQGAQRRFGERALTLLHDDPYALLAVPGFTWVHAEAIARRAGWQPGDERRLAAGAAEAQRQRCAREGHSALEAAELRAAARRLLGMDDDAVERGIALAAERELLVEEDGWWWEPGELAAETTLAGAIAELAGARARNVTAWTPDPELTSAQAAAAEAALREPVSLLTGGPGTGKTRTILEVVRACEAADLRLALCAPTGRAAKRMEELTGHPATTVHRLLGARPGADGGFSFTYGASRPLPFDVVVADEWSMADLRLSAALAEALDAGTHLVLVGDPDQLPSVGSGAVLRDLLAAAAGGALHATRLDVLHRQAAESRIVTLAHEVNGGEVPPLGGPARKHGDVFTVPEASELLADRVAEIVAVRAPAYFGCEPSDVQVLAPMYKGPAGVDRLNERLKQRLNPPGTRPAVAGFHEGDRVVATRNDVERDVANGDIGEVAAVDRRARTVEVAFPQGLVTFDTRAAQDLSPAWCLTVHKAQGAEWPVVVLVLDPGHRAMLWRELVYTAITRAGRGLLLVGEPGLVQAAARRTGSGASRRRTRLADRVTRAILDSGDDSSDKDQ